MVRAQTLGEPQLMITGYEERDAKEHIIKAYGYAGLPEEVRGDYFAKHGIRWYEFARLPYFDPVQMTMIDPMHDLLIGEYVMHHIPSPSLCISPGVLKNHWYHIWILGKALRPNTSKNKRELDLIHEYLSSV
jgi:hypothetical protein